MSSPISVKALAVFTCVTAASALTIHSGQAVASTPLQEAFEGLMQDAGVGGAVNAPSYLRSQTRSSFSLGSGRIRTGSARINSGAINLISVQPESSVSVGCNGIDWQLAGVSWASGEQLKQVLEAAIPAAVWYVVQLVIMAICGDCATALGNTLENIQRAINMLSNACEVGQHLVQDALNSAEPMRQAMCNRINAKRGNNEDYGAARRSCDSNRDTSTFFGEMWRTARGEASDGSAVDPADQATAKAEADKMDTLEGNQTWKILKKMGIVRSRRNDPNSAALSPLPTDADERNSFISSYVQGVLFQSMIGTRLIGFEDVQAEGCQDSGDCDNTEGFATSKLSVEDFLEFMMCGTEGLKTPPSGGGTVEVEAAQLTSAICKDLYNKNITTGPAFKVLACDPDAFTSTSGSGASATLRAYEDCVPTKAMPVEDWLNTLGAYAQSIYQKGFINLTIERILRGVDAIASKQPIPLEARQLIEQAPFPLYKMMNMATLYPGARALVTGDSALIIALLMAESYFEDVLYEARSYSRDERSGAYEVWQQINAQLAEMKLASRSFVIQIDEAQERAEFYTAKINAIESDLMRSVYSKNLFGSYSFASSYGASSSGTPSP